MGPQYYLAAHCMLYIPFPTKLNCSGEEFFFFFIPYSTNNANFFQRYYIVLHLKNDTAKLIHKNTVADYCMCQIANYNE